MTIDAEPAPLDRHAGDDNHDGHDDEAMGHGHDHGDHAAMFRQKFWVSLALTVPAVIFSHMLQDLLGYQTPMFWGHEWIAPIFGTLTFLYGGPVFLRAGWGELKSREPGMMLLISMGLLVAFGASVATEIG